MQNCFLLRLIPTYVYFFLIAIVVNRPLDDYDTDVATEENDDSSQPKEKKPKVKANTASFKHTLQLLHLSL